MNWVKQIKTLELKNNDCCCLINQHLKNGWRIIATYTPTPHSVTFVLGTDQRPNT